MFFFLFLIFRLFFSVPFFLLPILVEVLHKLIWKILNYLKKNPEGHLWSVCTPLRSTKHFYNYTVYTSTMYDYLTVAVQSDIKKNHFWILLLTLEKFSIINSNFFSKNCNSSPLTTVVLIVLSLSGLKFLSLIFPFINFFLMYRICKIYWKIWKIEVLFKILNKVKLCCLKISTPKNTKKR